MFHKPLLMPLARRVIRLAAMLALVLMTVVTVQLMSPTVSGSALQVEQVVESTELNSDVSNMTVTTNSETAFATSSAANTEVTLNGGVLTITDINGGDSDDALTISYSGGDYTIQDSGGLILTTAIAGASGDSTDTLVIPDTGVTGINFNTLGGDDTITIVSVQASLSDDFTIDGGTGTDSATINGDIVTTGSAAVNISVSQNILLSSGGSVTTVNGGITLNANTAGTTTGNFVGLKAENATISATGTGNISLNGKGATNANANSHQHGVELRDGTTVSSTSTGTISITGTGGNGTFRNYGIDIASNGTLVTSAAGNITLMGTGGDGTGDRNFGVQINTGATAVQSTGTATIGITGQGGNGTHSNYGIEMVSNGTLVTSVTGDITLMGTGGDGSDNSNIGVKIDTGAVAVQSTGSAALSLTGQGGDGVGNNYGIELVSSGTMITSVDGNVTLNGTGGNGSSSFNTGVRLETQGAAIQSTGAATIGITGLGGDGTTSNYGIEMVGNGTLVTSAAGDITLMGTGGDGSDNSNFGVRINTGAVAVQSTGSATLSLTGQGGDGVGNNYGIELSGSGTSVSSTDGNVTLNGTGGNGSSSFNTGVRLETQGAAIQSTGAATIGITGLGGDGTDSNYGIEMVGSNTSITSVTGDMALMGTGGVGTGNSNFGVRIDTGGGTAISSTGATAAAATISVTGIGGNATTHDNRGIQLNNSTITSVAGDITLDGTGRGAGNNGWGIFLENNAAVTSTGTGANAASINVTGAGSGAFDTHGIYFLSTSGSVTTVDGDITLNGTANGSSGNGIRIRPGVLQSTGSGNLSVTANSVNGEDLNTDNATLDAGPSGTLTITADELTLHNMVDGDGDLLLIPRTAGTTIGLGNGASGTFNLDSNELGFLQDGFSSITIGDAAAGTGAVDINSVTFLDPVTIAGGTINDNTGTDITAPSVTLDGNVAPGQSPGQLVVNGDLNLVSGETLTIEIDGTAGAGVASGHDQIAVTGAVNLNNAVLTGALGFTPADGTDFIIIDNDGTDAVTGTFNGLNEGATFVIGDRQFTITYMGGSDNNDVVLQNAMPLAVTLALFETEADSDSVLIRWQTVSERNNLGFNLYRATEIDGQQEQLNPSLIPAQAPGSGQGAAYEWRDTNIEVGSTYFYWLEDVDVNGETNRHGPVSATITEPTAVTTGEFTIRSQPSLLWALLPIGLLLAGAYWRRRQR